MTDRRRSALDALAAEALGIGDVRSAAVFVPVTAGGLALAGAAGIDGPALDGLVAAVQSPAHPVHRAVSDADPTFDVLPVNPGGPKLRSHLPLRLDGGLDRRPAAAAPGLGVLALAHEAPMSDDARASLAALAARMAATLADPMGSPEG